MELQLGLALPLHNKATDCIKRKRSFDKPAIKNERPQSLPLLSWSDQPKDEDDRDQPRGRHVCTIEKEDEDHNRVVGWPPIESWRKKAFHRRLPGRRMVENRRPVADSNQNGGSNSPFVKVKMEGVAIARKLDLRLHHSHQSLKTALIAMFAACKPTFHSYRRGKLVIADESIDKKGWDFTLIYEDKEGDWLLAEDLPWNSFVESVQRLKILVRKRNKD